MISGCRAVWATTTHVPVRWCTWPCSTAASVPLQHGSQLWQLSAAVPLQYPHTNPENHFAKWGFQNIKISISHWQLQFYFRKLVLFVNSKGSSSRKFHPHFQTLIEHDHISNFFWIKCLSYVHKSLYKHLIIEVSVVVTRHLKQC